MKLNHKTAAQVGEEKKQSQIRQINRECKQAIIEQYSEARQRNALLGLLPESEIEEIKNHITACREQAKQQREQITDQS